jgi:hypothetical protein
MVAPRCATTGAAQRCAFARTHAWATLTIALAEAAHGSPMLRRASTLVALTLAPPLDEDRKPRPSPSRVRKPVQATLPRRRVGGPRVRLLDVKPDVWQRQGLHLSI